jgi:hypothetical protein
MNAEHGWPSARRGTQASENGSSGSVPQCRAASQSASSLQGSPSVRGTSQRSTTQTRPCVSSHMPSKKQEAPRPHAATHVSVTGSHERLSAQAMSSVDGGGAGSVSSAYRQGWPSAWPTWQVPSRSEQ